MVHDQGTICGTLTKPKMPAARFSLAHTLARSTWYARCANRRCLSLKGLEGVFTFDLAQDGRE